MAAQQEQLAEQIYDFNELSTQTDYPTRAVCSEIRAAVKRVIVDRRRLAEAFLAADEMVKDAPTWKEVYDQLQQVVSGKNVASYNADFDLRMIYESGKRFAGLFGVLPDLRAKSFACAMRRYASFYGEWSEHHGSYRWQPLQQP